MWPAIMQAWPTFTDRFEGCLPFMYLDQLGLVTTGRGNLLEPMSSALPLPWLRKRRSVTATQDEIMREWGRVKAHQEMREHGGGVFAGITMLFLPQPAIDALTRVRLEMNESALTRGQLAPVWSELCADAQMACHSMAWALGAGFPGKFPRWLAAMLAGDYLTASLECAIGAPQNDSIRARNAANAGFFQAANAVQKTGLAPARLWGLQPWVDPPPSAGGANAGT